MAKLKPDFQYFIVGSLLVSTRVCVNAMAKLKPHFQYFIVGSLLVSTRVSVNAMPVPGSFEDLRAQIITQEKNMKIGVGLTLTDKEKELDKLILTEKASIIADSLTMGKTFLPAVNFLKAGSLMQNAALFRIISKMPKGGALHLHKSALVSLDWVISDITYRENLFVCIKSDYTLMLQFFNTPPVNKDCVWTRLSKYRLNLGHEQKQIFEKSLRDNMTLVTETPDTAYPNINSVWDKFEMYFKLIGPLIYHTPVYKDYLRRGLKEYLDDGVQYLELRGSLPKLYELDGTEHPREWSINNVYKPIFNEFRQDNPDFIGAKLIVSTFRGKTQDQMLSWVKENMEIYRKYPDLVVGLDMVGQEDRFHSLHYFKEALLYPSKQKPPVHLPYFFHAGETDWLETEVDWNLVDAIVLNSSRIGHGYALHKHPVLLEKVKKRGIAIEVNPISNQVLKLVGDLRNHPAAMLITQNFPVVISSDDAAVWDALPLSHDFYVTLLALTGKETGLATLKQLAINSITYSAMNTTEKAEAKKKWETNWNKFIEAEYALAQASQSTKNQGLIPVA